MSIYTKVFTRKSLLPNPEAIPLTISARKRSIVNAYLILGVYEDHQDLFVCLMLKAKEAWRLEATLNFFLFFLRKKYTYICIWEQEQDPSEWKRITERERERKKNESDLEGSCSSTLCKGILEAFLLGETTVMQVKIEPFSVYNIWGT